MGAAMTIRRLEAWQVPSATEAGKTYIVTLDPRSCTCQGFASRQTCRHLHEAEEFEKREWEQRNPEAVEERRRHLNDDMTRMYGPRR